MLLMRQVSWQSTDASSSIFHSAIDYGGYPKNLRLMEFLCTTTSRDGSTKNGVFGLRGLPFVSPGILAHDGSNARIHCHTRRHILLK